MEFTVAKIADLLSGTVDGNPDAKIYRVSGIVEAKQGSITFLSNQKYTNLIYSTSATAVVVSSDFKPKSKVNSTIIRVDNPYQSLSKLLSLYEGLKKNKKGIEQPSHIGRDVSLGEGIYLGKFSYVDDNSVIGNGVKIHSGVYISNDVRIGDNTVLYPGVRVYNNCVIGDNCVLHSNVVIGSDGFGFAQATTHYERVPQIGNVIIGNNVSIGSGSTVDRATIGSTVISDGVKLDNLIQIAHNVEIGSNTVIAAQSGISGSTKIGANCMIGGQVGISGHINIEDNVKIAAKSGIQNNIKKGRTVMGNPSMDISNYRRSYVWFKNIGELVDRIFSLEKKIKNDSKAEDDTK
ncbi:UDP-3-O-(3-hydroxymyristoyl)glucosamine N-acyltransferase [Ichthyobacterium seriolicida]|uniref:UDP-3-O-acylglucosamine N-acyltransferase n=1 Tax=Ichthyobacterium seriolicida TaxID=242600 RepID=A0A1J1EAI2_9FLAO|nr:UDP-3-O-(3-hydroxymyristoyl)glucosamine N-acyltransferase [Ichthyobacterium seriolicida]BAV94947.1 UDP-3-O-[3-hydroxymyristoyl] glucosamine N-acyltransferase [Ichthyobacterium seriolicida]